MIVKRYEMKEYGQMIDSIRTTQDYRNTFVIYVPSIITDEKDIEEYKEAFATAMVEALKTIRESTTWAKYVLSRQDMDTLYSGASLIRYCMNDPANKDYNPKTPVIKICGHSRKARRQGRIDVLLQVPHQFCDPGVKLADNDHYVRMETYNVGQLHAGDIIVYGYDANIKTVFLEVCQNTSRTKGSSSDDNTRVD